MNIALDTDEIATLAKIISNYPLEDKELVDVLRIISYVEPIIISQFLIKRLDTGDNSVIKTLQSVGGDCTLAIEVAKSVTQLLKQKLLGRDIREGNTQYTKNLLREVVSLTRSNSNPTVVHDAVQLIALSYYQATAFGASRPTSAIACDKAVRFNRSAAMTDLKETLAELKGE